MAIYIKERWKKYLPEIDFYMHIPFVTVRIEFFRDALERDAYDFTRLYIKVFRWDFHFNLFKSRVRW